ncbi:MAG TPA: iron ABC transporter permease [Gemmatimonadaceae bacterium]|nr:iron ABC transporter permease [Gemmatimonadaceae bacterium]
MTRRDAFWPVAAGALLAAAALGVALGSVRLSPAEVWGALLGQGDPSTLAIVRTLRLPRAALAALVGAGLAMAGTALQGSLRNALAEPYLLGVSGGAAVGAVLGATLGVPPAAVPGAAFGGALAAVTVTLGVARAVGGRGDARVLLMAGVVVGAFANAVIMVALSNADPNAVRGALWWMMGSLSGADWAQVRWVAVYVVVGGGALLALARDLDVLALGDESAAALGLDVERAARRIFALASLLAAATVAAAGLIGFVGLVVPHIVRAFGVRAHRPLLAGAALVGGTLLLAADITARAARPPTELPLGAVTALVGVPFFLLQLRRLT